MIASDVLPYCGAPPLPDDLWWRWNLDPVLLAVLAAGFLLHRFAMGARGYAMLGGWLVLLTILISPFCALTSSLFSARSAHHVALVAIVAPLLVMALPRQWRSVQFSSALLSVIFAASVVWMWLWHAPSVYALTLASVPFYWLMEAGLLLSALLLWMAVLSDRTPVTSSFALLLGSVIQMGMLGALLTFAREPLYAFHLLTTTPFGLSARGDQQLAGLIMWVPAAIPYMIAALALLLKRIERDSKTEPAC
jgi:putative membrane protein